MFTLLPGSHIATIAASSDTTGADPTGQGLLVIVTVVVLVAFAVRLAGRALAPIGVIIRSIVSIGFAALALLAAFALLVFYAVSQM